MIKTVAVLMGGWSDEREVSLVSGKACAEALKEQEYDVKTIDVKCDMKTLMKDIEEASPDVIFNALHGKGGEDGCIQGVLEVLGIPYTHSGVLASSLAMDKEKSKAIFRDCDIPCPKGSVIPIKDVKAGNKIPVSLPYVVKPNREGSSVGIYIIRENKDLAKLDNWKYGDYALVEEYIEGREISVAVKGALEEEPEAFTVTEIITDREFYDYEAKYSDGGSKHIIPAEIAADVFAKVIDYAELAHKKLGCSGVTRADFRYNGKDGVDGLYILEVNTQPGMTPTSLVPEQASYRKMNFGKLVKWMVENAAVHY